MKKCFMVSIVALSMVILLSPCNSQAASSTASTTKKAATSSTKAKSSTNAVASSTAAQPQTGGTLKLFMTRPPVSFGYPPRIVGPDTNYAVPFFNRLLRVDDKGDIKPELATAWDVSPDGKTITFKLRQGVKFHDGTDFNAAAVKFNYESLMPPKSTVLTGVKSVDVVDDYTVKLNLAGFNNIILFLIASNYGCCIYSPTAVQKNGVDWAATHPVGTGPFKMSRFDPASGIKYVKNEDYWEKGLPYLDALEVKTVTDPMTQMMAFKTGESNGIYDAVPTTAAQLRDAGYKLIIAPGALYCLTFDSKNSDILSKPLVRQAIEYAVDKAAICNGPGVGLYKPVYQIVTDASPDYNQSCIPRKYDPEKAKALLNEAGYPNGFTFKGFFQDNTWKDGVVAVQSYLAKVGITMDINYVSSAAYANIRTLGKIEKGSAAQATLEVLSDSLYMMDLYLRSDSMFFQYMARPAGIDSLISQAKAVKDQASMTKLNKQIVKLAYDDETVVPLWLNPRIVVLDNSVQDPGFFIFNDSNNNKYGFSTWLKK